jgi:heavy metal translocating P-type ATPase
VRLSNVKYEDEHTLKRSLEQNYGICHAQVNLFEGLLTIEYNPNKISLEEVRKALTLPNFMLEKTIRSAVGSFLEKYGQRMRLSFSSVFIVLSWILFAVFQESYKFHWSLEAVIILYILVNGAAIVIAGTPTIQSSYKAVRQKKLNVHVLISIASIAAILIGDWLEAATVLYITIIGSALENLSLNRSNKDMFSVLMLGTKEALVKDVDNGTTVKIPVHKVQKGQIIAVYQGMKVPVDGIIKQGNVQINEAPITGESAFHQKSDGDKVYAGTIVEHGSMEMETVAAGGNTVLAQVAKLVEKARKERTSSEKVVDKFARFAIPVILFIAVAVFLVALFLGVPAIEALERGITILIVACPCALVLATPTAVNAGIARVAKIGILFKNGSVMENLAKVKTLFMDKTGTLTYSRPTIIGSRTFSGYTEDEVLKAAAFVEQKSLHPLARAICKQCQNRELDIEEPDKFLEFEGGGAVAIKGDKYVKVGALWLMEDGREFTQEVTDYIEETKKQGATNVIVANRKDIMGIFRMADEVRADAKQTIEDLRKAGIEKFVMITGDNERVAAHVTKMLGIDEYVAQCMPDTKLARIREERKNGRIVAMVGDGINDAPALVEADVGISMGAMGSEAAVEAGDVSLMKDNIADLTKAIHFSKLTLGTIKVNIIIAVIVNIAAVALASSGLLSMLWGAVIHQASALVVIFNSMTLFIRK